jgi:16S rRNA A1518/A1519 N6-dimethyltransferase RsmA/KsgA/DIM1 with predicted DNA glycosylase/AP lyase activity
MTIYTQDQNNWNFQQSTVENFWNRVRNKAIEAELNSLGVDKEKLILEIGCGVGVIGRHLLEKKFNYLFIIFY